MSKSFGEMVRVQSENRQEWIQEVREKRLHGTVDGWSSVPHLANCQPCHDAKEMSGQGPIDHKEERG